MEVKQDFIEFIELLNSEKIKYLVLGGYAVSFHIRPRATGDIDFFYSLEEDNCSRLERVLKQFVGPSNIDADHLALTGKITMIGIPPNRIDLINDVSGLTFDDAWGNRVKGRYGATHCWFISKLDLLKNKKAAGRPKDLTDISWLESKSQ